MDQRMSKDKYYLNIADAVLDRSTCLRRKYGAIIVKNDEILSTGYNGAPRGRVNCSELGYCNREQLRIPSGQRYELCRSVHAEANAIISAARRWTIWAARCISTRRATRSKSSRKRARRTASGTTPKTASACKSASRRSSTSSIATPSSPARGRIC